MKKTERLVPEGNNKMLMIRNRYDRDGNIITPDDYGKREPPEGFMDFFNRSVYTDCKGKGATWEDIITPMISSLCNCD